MFSVPFTLSNLWWSSIGVMLTHQVMLKNENGAWPKNDVQNMQRMLRKIIGEIMIATYSLKSCFAYWKPQCLSWKDHDNCHAFLNQEQEIQQDFTSHPHLIAELLF